MPFPPATSYTHTKWLAFFAELTAKLTHHNVLVVMEGAELLKRLLISRVSIAAFLQQGELLVRLLDSWRGCVTAGRPHTASSVDYDGASPPAPASSSAAVALNDELSFVLAESISQCIDLMLSLYSDGDTYYCLLVLARAGPMLEVLVDVLQTAPPQLYGITASLAQQLLALPLGRSEVAMKLTAEGEVDAFTGLDAATAAQIHKSVALRRHVRALVEAVQEHGALLQHTADVLAGLLAVQQGPRCLAAVSLFNAAAKRLRKFELRSERPSAAASQSPSVARDDDAAPERTTENSELNVTITGAPQAASSSPASQGWCSKPPQTAVAATASALDDLEEGVETPIDTSSTWKGGTKATSQASPEKNSAAASPGASDAKEEETGNGGGNGYVAPQDVSALVDDEPAHYACTVPPALAAEALQHLTSARSHDAFFDAIDWLWCLSVADPVVVGAELSPEILSQGLSRYLTAVPRTRRDRILFTLLLLWLGHLHSISALRPDTHRSLLSLAASSLLPMLHAELRAKDGEAATGQQQGASTTASPNVSAISPTYNGSGAASAMALAASSGYNVPAADSADTASFSAFGAGGGLPFQRFGGSAGSWSRADEHRPAAVYSSPPNGTEATLLPYAAARKAQEAALLLRPSIEVILLSFLLNMYAGIDSEGRRAWVCDGRVLNVALAAVQRCSGVRSALVDTPAAIDGALSDEVYLDHALRSVRTDVTTVAVLGCRLMAAVLGSDLRWGAGWHDTLHKRATDPNDPNCAGSRDDARAAAAAAAEMALFTQVAMPLLVHIAVHNPDVATSSDGNTTSSGGGATSPVHYVPANLRCARYTSLGESSLVALDACLQYCAQSGGLRSRGSFAGVADDAPVAMEDLVRVLPALTRVSRFSVHPPVRAVPYRCLLYVSRRIEEVLVVLRDMPSLANAAVSCVLDYSAASSQWEVAAAAEWLTVLVDLLTAAVETPTAAEAQSPPPQVDTTLVGAAVDAEARVQRQRRLLGSSASAAEQLLEYFHFDDSPLARRLLPSVVAARRSNTGSAYAMTALLQLAVHLQTYLLVKQRSTAVGLQLRRNAPTQNPTVQNSAVLPLTPAGLSSIPQWIRLLQSTTADNTRLSRICAAFQRTRSGHVSGAAYQKRDSDRCGAVEEGEEAHHSSSARAVLRDAWARAFTASEQIALQYTFTATLFRALEMALQGLPPSSDSSFSSAPTLYAAQLSNGLVCSAVASAVRVPPPHDVAALLSMRFHASCTPTSPLSCPALVLGYEALLQWACCFGAGWLRGTFLASDAKRTSCGGGLPEPCAAALVEDLCTGACTAMQDAAGQLSQRTRCLAASLMSALVDACSATQLSILEARGADLFAASTSLRRVSSVSGLQCRLLRRVGSAARYAASAEHRWLQDTLEALKSTVEQIKSRSPAASGTAANHRSRRASPRHSLGGTDQHRGSRDSAAVARELLAFQVLTSALSSLVTCTATTSSSSSTTGLLSPVTALLPSPQRRELCAVLCDSLCVPSLRHCVLTALRNMADTAEGRRCLLTDISSAGDPLGRTLFGRVLALTLHIPCRWAERDGSSGGSCGVGFDRRGHSVSRASSPTSTSSPQHRQRNPRSISPSPRASSLPGSSPRPSRTAEGVADDDADVEGDPVVVLGCDICTTLLGRTVAGDGGSSAVANEEEGGSATSAPSASFLAAFLRHRGLECLVKCITTSDHQQRRQGRNVFVPPHLLRLLAALSLHASVVKDVVQAADLFSVVLDLAGAAFPPHFAASTLAHLILRNVCFDAGLKSALSQDVRVVLTLKAACLKLQCVSELLEDTSSVSSSAPRPSAHTRPKAAAGGESKRHLTRVAVVLREDVVDHENVTAVAWATQLCVYARARRGDVNAFGDTKSVAAQRRPAFGDITNAVTTPPQPLADASVLSSEWDGRAEASLRETATDGEAARRQYLAATALASLWFDNQRGKAAIAAVLAAAPPLKIEDVQALARST